jgi:hypothetical protein
VLHGQLIKQVSLAAVNENIAFPFTTYTPIHPGIETGLTFWQKENEHSIQQVNANLGYFFHEKVESAFYLNGTYMYRVKVKGFLSIDFSAFAGYMHTLYPGSLYEIDPENGAITRVNQYGRPHAMAGIGFGLTYRNSSRFEPFIRQEMSVESPFANGIPVMIHSFLKLGVNIKF